jgi:predicted acyl esterase
MKSFLLVFLLLYSLTTRAALDWTEVQIPMSDNMTLAGDIYLPENWTSGPVILIQTPYNKNLVHFVGLPLGVGYNQEESPYAFVIVDWRGRFGSLDAAYIGAPDTGEDGYDVVEWIAAQEWSDGNIGTWGPSALGRVQYETARNHPPHLKCIAPLVAAPTYSYQEYFVNGVARTEFIEQLDNLGFNMSTGLYAHPYFDFSWLAVETYYDFMDEIDIPVFMIAGWYDHNIDLMLPSFSSLQSSSDPDVQDQHKLLIGPWAHGGNGTASVGSPNQGQLSYPEADGMNNQMVLQFFDYYLKGIQNGWSEVAPVTYFQMGENNWQTSASWPPVIDENLKLYFSNDGSLSPGLPLSSASLQLTYDPNDPSPTIGGPTLRNDLEQGPFDQAPQVESRNDILAFTTSELSAPVVIKGQPELKVTLSSDVLDTDIAVRFCDVYPDGRSMLISDGIYRLRFLNGFDETDETFLVPGQDYEVSFLLPNTSITFPVGHKIRVNISGSNYPRFNRNMNTGGEMYPDGNGDSLIDPLIAHSLIQMSTDGNNGSYITIPIVGDYPSSVNEVSYIHFSMSPNPTSDHVSIQFEKWNSSEVLSIFDGQGKLIQEIKVLSPWLKLDVSNWSSGVYTLKTRSSGSQQMIVTR